MSSTDRYVIANKDGKFASEFGGGKHFRFGDFRTEMTTFYHSEREAKNSIAELLKRGYFNEDGLHVVKFGIMPLEETDERV